MRGAAEEAPPNTPDTIISAIDHARRNGLNILFALSKSTPPPLELGQMPDPWS